MQAEPNNWDPEHDEAVSRALKEIGCEAADDLTWLNLQDSLDAPAFDQRGQEVVYRWSEEAPWGDFSTNLTHWIPYPSGAILYYGVVPAVSEDSDDRERESGWVRPGPPLALYMLVPAAESDVGKEELMPWLQSDVPTMRTSALAALGEVPA